MATPEEREAYRRKKRALGEKKTRFMWRLKESMHYEDGRVRVQPHVIIDATGVTWTTFKAWERGQRIPRRQSLIKIAAVLNVSPNWLLGKEELS